MSGQNIFHQNDRLGVNIVSQLLSKVEFSSQEVADGPKPFLNTEFTFSLYWY